MLQYFELYYSRVITKIMYRTRLAPDSFDFLCSALFLIATYTFLKLASLCFYFPLTFELILPLITFPFFFLHAPLSLTRLFSPSISPAIQCVLFPYMTGFFLFILFNSLFILGMNIQVCTNL